MKKMVLVFTLAVFALSGSAFAQDPNWSDNIGVYLTPGGYMNPIPGDGTGSCGFRTPNTGFHAYMVVSQMTQPEVWGWEAQIFTENLIILNAAIQGGDFVNAGTGLGEYIIGLTNPIVAVDNAALLCDFTLMVNPEAEQPAHVFIEGVFFSSLDSGLPAYLDGPGGSFVAMHNVFGDVLNPDDSVPVLVVNGDCDVVGVEENTWGSVKSMFR